MRKRHLGNLDKDSLEEIESAINEKRIIKIKPTNNMANKKVVFKKDFSLTKKQKDLVETILDNETRIVVIEGPPGSAKTFTSIYGALKLYENKEIDKIYLTKPIVQVGDALGHLPGTKEEKVNPYLESFMTNFESILEGTSLTNIQNNNDIEFKIVQYMRGCNYKNMILIVDEMQNFSIKELMTIVTRLSKDSKIIFLGDIRQNDINKKYVGVTHFKKVLENVKGVSFFKFANEDILRDPILVQIVENYDRLMLEMPESKNNA